MENSDMENNSYTLKEAIHDYYKDKVKKYKGTKLEATYQNVLDQDDFRDTYRKLFERLYFIFGTYEYEYQTIRSDNPDVVKKNPYKIKYYVPMLNNILENHEVLLADKCNSNFDKIICLLFYAAAVKCIEEFNDNDYLERTRAISELFSLLKATIKNRTDDSNYIEDAPVGDNKTITDKINELFDSYLFDPYTIEEPTATEGKHSIYSVVPPFSFTDEHGKSYSSTQNDEDTQLVYFQACFCWHTRETLHKYPTSKTFIDKFEYIKDMPGKYFSSMIKSFPAIYSYYRNKLLHTEPKLGELNQAESDFIVYLLDCFDDPKYIPSAVNRSRVNLDAIKAGNWEHIKLSIRKKILKQIKKIMLSDSPNDFSRINKYVQATSKKDLENRIADIHDKLIYPKKYRIKTKMQEISNTVIQCAELQDDKLLTILENQLNCFKTALDETLKPYTCQSDQNSSVFDDYYIKQIEVGLCNKRKKNAMKKVESTTDENTITSK